MPFDESLFEFLDEEEQQELATASPAVSAPEPRFDENLFASLEQEEAGGLPKTALDDKDERAFRTWYGEIARQQGLNPDPDDPRHFYDYRGAYLAGARPDQFGHWPSEFKMAGHPRMVIDGVNTQTGEHVQPSGLPPMEGFQPPYEQVPDPLVEQEQMQERIRQGYEPQESRFRINIPQRITGKGFESTVTREVPAPGGMREAIERGVAVGAGRVLGSKGVAAGAAMRNIEVPEAYDPKNADQRQLAEKGKELGNKLFNFDADVQYLARTAQGSEELSSAVQAKESWLNSLTDDDRRALSFYQKHEQSINGQETELDKKLLEADRKMSKWLKTKGSKKAIDVGRSILKSVPEDWAEQIAAESGKDVSPKRMVSDPKGWLITATSEFGQQIPIITDQIVSSAVGSAVAGPAGGAVAGTASMIGLEAAGFLDEADQYKAQLPEDQRDEFQEIVDKYAFTYGVGAGALEYLGNAVSSIGALKSLAAPAKKALVGQVLERAIGMTGEGATEFSQSSLQNYFMDRAIKDMQAINPDFQPEVHGEDPTRSFWSGVVVAGPSAMLSVGGNIAQNIAAGQDAGDTQIENVTPTPPTSQGPQTPGQMETGGPNVEQAPAPQEAPQELVHPAQTAPTEQVTPPAPVEAQVATEEEQAAAQAARESLAEEEPVQPSPQPTMLPKASEATEEAPLPEGVQKAFSKARERQEAQTRPTTPQEGVEGKAGQEEAPQAPSMQRQAKPFDQKRWSFTVGGRKESRITLDSRAQELMKDDPELTPEKARRYSERLSMNDITKVPGPAYFNQWVDDVFQKGRSDERVNHYHLHGDEMAVAASWVDENGEQLTLIAKPDINFFSAMNDTKRLGHEWTDELNKMFQQETNELIQNDLAWNAAKTKEEKVAAFVDLIRNWKEAANSLEIDVGEGQTVPLGISIGVGVDPVSAETMLNEGKEKVGRNSIAVDNTLKQLYNITDEQGKDIAETYWNAGLRSDKLKEAYNAIREGKEAGREGGVQGENVSQPERSVSGRSEGPDAGSPNAEEAGLEGLSDAEREAVLRVRRRGAWTPQSATIENSDLEVMYDLSDEDRTQALNNIFGGITDERFDEMQDGAKPKDSDEAWWLKQIEDELQSDLDTAIKNRDTLDAEGLLKKLRGRYEQRKKRQARRVSKAKGTKPPAAATETGGKGRRVSGAEGEPRVPPAQWGEERRRGDVPKLQRTTAEGRREGASAERASEERNIVTGDANEASVRKMREVVTENLTEDTPAGVADGIQAVEGTDSEGIRVASIVADPFGTKISPFSMTQASVDALGFAIGGVRVPTVKNTIYMNIRNSGKGGFLNTVGHELFHEMSFESPELFDAFVVAVEANLTDAGRRRLIQIYVQEKEDFGHVLDEEELGFKAIDELGAEFSGEQFTTKSFWDKLYSMSPKAFRKAIEILQRILEKMAGVTRESDAWFSDLESMQNLLAGLLEERRETKAQEQAGTPSFQRKTSGNVDAHRAEAIDKFGTTNNVRAAGFVLPDGTMLDFRRDTSDPVEHTDVEEISDVYQDDFVREGNMRVDAKWPLVQVGAKPTTEQLGAIRQIVDGNADANLRIELNDGDRRWYHEYPVETSYNKVRGDIGVFYSGKEPRRGKVSFQRQPARDTFFSPALRAAESLKQEKGTASEDFVYHRGKDPRTSKYIVLYSDSDAAVEHYGSEQYALDKKYLVPIPPWVKSWAEDYYREEYGDDYEKYTAPEVDPDNIVSTAGAWDSEQFVSDFWQAHESQLLNMRENGIYGFKTQDGAVVFPGEDTPVSETMSGGQPMFQRQKAKPLTERKPLPKGAPEGVRQAYSDVAEIESVARGLRGTLRGLSDEQIAERSNIELALRAVKDAGADIVRNSIYQYARNVGLGGVRYNRVDTILKNAKSATDLRNAVYAIDEQWKKAMNRQLLKAVRDKIASEDARLRKQAGKGRSRQALRQNQRMREYIDQFVSVPADKLERLEKSMNWFMQNPDAEMPAEMKRDMKALWGKRLEEMDNRELAHVLQDINAIKKYGYLKWQLQAEQRKRMLAREISHATEEIGRVVEKTQAQRMAEAPKGIGKLLEGARNASSNFFWMHIRPERAIEWFSGWKKSSRFKESTFGRMLSAERAKLQGMERASKTVSAIHNGIDINKAMRDKFMEIPILEIDENGEPQAGSLDITLNQAMFIYANSQNSGNRAHLNGTGISDDAITSVVNALPDNAKLAVDRMIDYFDTDQYERVNQTFQYEHNVDMPKEHRYFPIMGLLTDRAENAIVVDLIARKTSHLGTLQKGFTKARNPKSAAPFQRLSYFDTISNSINSAEHYVAYARPVKEVNEILSNRDVRHSMDERNKSAATEIRNWVKAVAYGRLRGEKDPISNMVRALRTNYSLAVLGFNLVTSAKQAASYAQGLSMVDKGAAMKATLMQVRDPRPTGYVNKFVNSKSVMMRNRAGTQERELSEMRESMQRPGKGKIGAARELVMGLITGIDKLTTNSLWLGKYQEVLNRSGDEQSAIEQADELIRKTQPMGGLTHLAGMYRSNEFVRAITMFTSQLNQNINIVFELGSRAAQGKISKEEFVQKFILSFVVAPGLLYMASHGFRPPWEDPEGWVEAAVDNMVGGVVFLGDLVGEGVGFAMNQARVAQGKKRQKRYGSEISAPPIETMNQILELASNPVPRRIGEQALEIGAKTAGIPYAQIRRGVKGWDKFKETRDPRYLVWSEGALSPVDVKSAMIRRIVSSVPTTEDSEAFAKWWKQANPEERAEVKREAHAELMRKEASKAAEGKKTTEWTSKKVGSKIMKLYSKHLKK
jgi:hypothetical protein